MNKKSIVNLRYRYRGAWKNRAESLEKIARWIKEGRNKRQVSNIRRQLLAADDDEKAQMEAVAGGLPFVQPLTGTVVLSLGATEGLPLVSRLRRRVNMMPQTRLSFLAADGRSLVVVQCYERLDGSLPTDAREAALFNQYALRRAADFVWAATGVKPDEEAATGFYLSSDSEAYWNSAVRAVGMEQPTSQLDEQSASPLPRPMLLPEHEVLPGYSLLEMDLMRFNAVCRRLAFGRQHEGDDYLLALAAGCHKADIDQEVATKCILSLEDYREKEVLVRSTVENAYQRHRTGLLNPIEPTLMHQQLMKDFLLRRYLFRRNRVTGDVEYREKDRYILAWRPVTEAVRNDINNAAIDEGIKVWPQDMNRLLESSQVTEYDPVREWLQQLPTWDGRDRLGELADRVPTRAEGWRDNFKVWMRSMVSQWQSGADRMYGAQMVFMLIGGQGTRKSTFMRLLLPPELRPFYIDRIDFANKKEALRALSRFLLINIDEYDQISRAQTAYLKHLIQRSDVKERRMYETSYQQVQRYAAFCATTNSLVPLKDESGSRRYMVVEVSGPIDTDTNAGRAIDYPQLYAQLCEEIRRGEPSYFDGERERRIVEQGADYYETPNVIMMFDDLYRKPHQGDEVLLLSPMELLTSIREACHTNVATQSNSVVLGNYLHRRGYQKGRGEQRRKYMVVRRG